MPDRAARIVLAILIAVSVTSTALPAESSIEGVWLGVSSEVGSVYRLELASSGSGKLQYVSHVGEEPALRTYAVRSWSLDGGRVELELEPLGDAPELRLRGKVKSGQLDLEIVRRKGDRPEPLRMSPEDRFLADFELIRESNAGG